MLPVFLAAQQQRHAAKCPSPPPPPALKSPTIRVARRTARSNQWQAAENLLLLKRRTALESV